MSQYDELKRAASEAKNWGGEVGEGRWYTAECFKRPYFSIPDAEFIAACEPGAVLALIAENEELGRYLCTCRDCGGEGELHTGDWHSYGHMEPPEPVMEKCGECDGTGLLGEIQDLYQVITERDRLRAEVAGLRTGYEAYEQVNAELKAECARSTEREIQQLAEIEVLRKALESCADELSAEVICKHGGQKLEDMHPVTRRLYDRDMASVIDARAALGQGEQS